MELHEILTIWKQFFMEENATKRVKQFFQITQLQHFKNFYILLYDIEFYPKKMYQNEFNEDRTHKTKSHAIYNVAKKNLANGPTPLGKFR